MNKAIDLYLVYQFLKRLAMPFTSWSAYKTGVIDETGKIIVRKENRTLEQKQSFGKFDLMILKLKKLLAKVPGGSTKIASYMAALWLIKEWNHFSDSTTLTEDISEDVINESLTLFSEWYLYYIPVLEEGNRKITEEDGGAPTVNVGSGNIAGLGVGPQGEPGLTKAQQKKHRRRARMSFADMVNRRIMPALVGEGIDIVPGSEPKKTTVARRRRHKKHTEPSIRIA